MRERLASRLGFIFLSAGCAIGLGNVWRFPYIAGQNGGGWFVVLYLVALALIGLPILLMEFAAGRAAQRSIVRLHATLTPEKSKVWRLHGVAGFLGNVILMMFYTTVTGWMLIYFARMASGAFVGLDAAAVGAAFGGMLGDPLTMAAAMLVVTAASTCVCVAGLQKGVERVTKGLMLCLLVLIVVLAVNSLCLDAKNSGSAGLAFYLVPDFARMKSVGVVKVVVEAMNHAFFTLSLGIGSMTICGSYVNEDRSLVSEAAWIIAIDTAVALLAGFIIFPACATYGVAYTSGPGLIFVALPQVFAQMAGGRFWGFLFFLFLACAALTTVIAVFECLIAGLMDSLGMKRLRATLLTGCGVALLSLPCVLWDGVLKWEDFAVSQLWLPLGALTQGFFVVNGRWGWGWENYRASVSAGTGWNLPAWIKYHYAVLIPILIAAVLIAGLVTFDYR